MIAPQTAKRFLDQKIVFSQEGQLPRCGILKEVTTDSIIIDFYGRTQVYSLDSIISMREYVGGDKNGRP